MKQEQIKKQILVAYEVIDSNLFLYALDHMKTFFEIWKNTFNNHA